MKINKFFVWLVLFELLAICIATGVGLHQGDPLRHFEERHFITWFSFTQLLAISVIAFMILRRKSSAANRKFYRLNSSTVLWAIIAFGFFFLAFDEIFLIHESTDEMIHSIFNLQETGWTDRIDDLLIGLYGVVAITILYRFRHQLMVYRQTAPFFIAGFTILFVMVLFDIVSNREDIFLLLLSDSAAALEAKTWASLIEDSLKVFAEGCFLTGFFLIFRSMPAAVFIPALKGS